jgi:hypothetical protein
MLFKFWKVAKVNRGNKKNYESNALIDRIARKQAEKDMKRERKREKQR